MKKPFVMNSAFFILTLSGIWAFAIGLRFILDGFFNGKIYAVNSFDVFVDWLPLLILGLFTIFYGFYLTVKKGEIKNETRL